MTWEWFAIAGPTVLALALAVALTRVRNRTRRDLAAARAEAAELRDRLDRLEQAAPAAGPDVAITPDREYRITRLGDPEPTGTTRVPERVDRAAFADLLLKESVIRLGSLAHGVRRALSPESRNRIRFEMRREVKRARKQRRSEQREAYREWRARQRELLTDDDLRESA